ncbi:hypothetical protein AURDEDRAFT_148678 [Auricularia subglabra TFB-10046 SS5]|nr:hypothetical protein AURDEDRAFT_148678 [Auricularia subglabra TFB-10046 SS5]
MRETIYLQAGATANFLHAHFFCTQFACYPEREDDDAPVEPDVCFRNARSQNARAPTPRAVVVDFKDNFRGIPVTDEQPDEDEALWTGRVEHYRRASKPPEDREITSWSDLPLDYDPARSLLPIPSNAHPDWDTAAPDSVGAWGDWSAGRERLVGVREDLEERVRALAEECDLLQGVQSAFDTPSFGSFGVGMLQGVKDEYFKTAILAIPILSASSYDATLAKLDDVATCRKILNDALTLTALDSADDPLASLIVPVQSPLSWKGEMWLDNVTLDLGNLYQSTALLSAHLDGATLPTRLAKPSEAIDLYTLIGQLNWRGHTRIAHLSGAFPLQQDPLALLYDFSASSSGLAVKREPYAARYVSRGLDAAAVAALDAQLEASSKLSHPLLQTTHAFAYAQHHTFPPLSTQAEPRVLSTLSTSSAPELLLGGLAKFVERAVAFKLDVGLGEDVDIDMLRETAERLWTLRDGYAEESESGSESASE